MPDLLVRRVPPALIKSLKRRAAHHGRSLQQELIAILESAAGEISNDTPAQVAASIRARLSRGGRRFADSVTSLRQDRKR